MILDMFKKKNQGPDDTSRLTLEQCQIQRARVDMVFEEGTTSIRELHCGLNTIAAGTLLLDVFGITGPGHFTGRAVTCYFRIRESKGATGFFACHTVIQDVRQTANGAIVMRVAMPSVVERSQRRRSVRVRVNLDWFQDFAVWRGELAHVPDPGSALLRIQDLKTPSASRLENISAGGLGMHLTRELRVRTSFAPIPREIFAIHMRFTQEMRNQPMALWFLARAVRILEDKISRDMDLGLEFVHVALPPAQDSPDQAFAWRHVEDNVTEELMQRVFAWHTTLFRERAGGA